jgi:hypothetical protein
VVNGLAVAPATGAAVLVLAGLAVDALGRSIGGVTALSVAAGVGLCGYAPAFVWWRGRRAAQRPGVLQRTPTADAPDQVGE